MNAKYVCGAVAVSAALAVAALAGCGDDDTSGDDGAQTDDAFLVEMAAHHEDAIEMAEIARAEAEHPQVRHLADDIVAAQGDEIDRMEAMHERLFDSPMNHDGMHSLAMDEHMMGMGMAPTALEGERPFDRAFIDAMIAHHQGAIRMARLVEERGDDPEVRELAEAVIGAQSAEIDEMNRWRMRWYGGESPAGGVPEMHSGEMPMHDEMGH